MSKTTLKIMCSFGRIKMRIKREGNGSLTPRIFLSGKRELEKARKLAEEGKLFCVGYGSAFVATDKFLEECEQVFEQDIADREERGEFLF